MKGIVQLSLILGLLVGCHRESADVVLVRIDGTPVTTADVREAVLLRAKMNELSGIQPEDVPFNQWANQTGARLFGSLINARLLEKEIAEKNVIPTSQDRDKVLSDYNKSTRQNAKSLEELARSFGDCGSAFLKVADRAVRLEAYRRLYWTVSLPDAIVHQHFVQLTNDMRRAAQIDADALSNANKAYARLQKGEKWDAVARACSEDRLVNRDFARYAQDWFSVSDDAMGMHELALQLPKMKPGDYTKPFEARDGLLIVRLNGKNGKLYKLSRMLFRMANPVVLPQDPETVRRQLCTGLEDKHRRETLKRLREAARFDYPMGTNFVYRIWPE